ncbi:MAG: YhcN/YlaJ family sporulation lipoprotein [Oscillospiraceae bacterium]|nr:YhcN/YlaJ family sporulation lipoprotein [Oscillospiraceae bacterium]
MKNYNSNTRNTRGIKLAAVAAFALIMTVTLAGCTSTTELTPIGSPSPSPVVLNPLPSVSPSVGPSGVSPLASPSAQPSTSDQPAAPTLSNQESAALAGQCDARISQISEIENSITVMLGSVALTGVSFTPQYKGELTTRINGIIGDSVRTIVPSISSVKVTSDSGITSRIASLRQKQLEGGSTGEVKEEFDSIQQSIK